MVSYKKGGGGKLEAFDEYGRYTEVTLNVEGHDINKWEDLIDLFLDDEQKEIYNKASAEDKKEVNDYLMNYHEQLFQQEVDKINTQYRVYSSVDETIQNAHELFTDDMIEWYFENERGGYITTFQGTGHRVPALPMALQMARYKYNRMKAISNDEFNKRIQKIFDETQKDSYGDPIGNNTLPSSCGHDRGYQYLETHTEIPVFRGMYVSSYDKETVRQGFFENGKDAPLSLMGNGCFGTCIYMSMSYDYSSGGYDEGILVKGIVKPEEAKWFDQQSYHNLKNEFVAKLPIFLNNLRNKMDNSPIFASGRYSKDKFLNTVENFIKNDRAFIPMLMGYDAMFADGNQFDILNPNVVELVDEKK